MGGEKEYVNAQQMTTVNRPGKEMKQSENIQPDFNNEDLKNPDPLKKHVNQMKNGFPVEVFSEDIQDVIRATNKSLNFPLDFISASILYAASVAIRKKAKIKTPNGWKERAVIYIALVGRPGTNKSHPLSFALEPIRKQDKQAHQQYDHERSEFEYVQSLSKKEREGEGLSEPEEPILTKRIVNDITPEALAFVHKNNPEGLGVYVDELAGWLKNFNRYNSGGEQEFWISCFSGKPIIIDRKTSQPIRVDDPFISVAGTIQTGVLNEFAKDNRTSNGFIDRILFAYPEGLKKDAWSEKELSRDIPESWENIISDISNIQGDREFTFTNEASNRLRKWQAENARLCNEAENEGIEGIYSKLEIYAIRLSLILQILNNRASTQINLESVEGAIKLVEYFRKTGSKIYDIVNNSNPLDHLPRNKRIFYESLSEVFETKYAVLKGKDYNMKERSIKDFLNDRRFFLRIERGRYEKKL